MRKQLTRRFGPLPEVVSRYIESADSEQLEYWGERLMSATVLDDVFTYRVMPSTRHEVLIGLLRSHPDLLAALLARLKSPLFPDLPGAVLAPVSSLFAGLSYTDELPDLVLHRRLQGQDEPAQGLVVQVPLAPSAKVEATWALFVAGIELRDSCPVALVVLTLDERTARWAATLGSRRTGHTGSVAPMVIGPAQIPRITELAQARAWPELAVLSAAAHGRSPGAEHVARAAILACAALAPLEHALYADFVVSCLGKRARRALEKLMPLEYSAPQSGAGQESHAEHPTHDAHEAR